MKAKKEQDWFTKFAAASARITGASMAFTASVLLIVGWGLSGPIFGFSEVWQLIINTATTIITFLMVFVIQNSQNRFEESIHLKVDEALRALEGADDKHFKGIEEESQEDLAHEKEQRE